MNMQAMIKQAQKIQQDMMATKEEINKTIYIGKSSFVSVEINGNKEVLKVTIDKEMLEKDEIELLEDMLVIALNDANNKVNAEIDKKMGKYAQGMPGLL